MSAPVDVRGGRGGLVARSDDLQRLAALLATGAAACATVALGVNAAALAAADPGAAVWDPVGAIEVTARLLALADGPAGIAGLALTTAELATRVQLAAAMYAATESAVESQLAAAVVGLFGLPRLAVVALTVLGRTGDPALALQAGLGADPGLVDAVLADLTLGRPAVVVRGLATAFPDGRPLLTGHGADAAFDAAGPPRSVSDLITGLASRNDGVPGEIDVQVLVTRRSDGTEERRAVVDIPGTKDWSLTTANPDVTGLGSDFRALTGQVTTYEAGVFAALRAAGVEAGDAVLFVGHSLGGMVALAAGRDATAFGYRAGGVVTAGAPLGLTAPPPGVPVLALENAGDVVPHLDGRSDPTSADVVVATVNHPGPTVGAAHSLRESYLPGARDIDVDSDPSVVAVRERLAPFLNADTRATQVYVVGRELP